METINTKATQEQRLPCQSDCIPQEPIVPIGKGRKEETVSLNTPSGGCSQREHNLNSAKEMDSEAAILVLGILSPICIAVAYILVAIANIGPLQNYLMFINFSLLGIAVALAVISIVMSARFRKRNGFLTGKTIVGRVFSIVSLATVGATVSVYVFMALGFYIGGIIHNKL